MPGPRGQHYVPVCYLREWVDSKHPDHVWVFNKDGSGRRKQRPESILKSNDLYTLNIKGTKDYRIETKLADLEGQYATLVREKIKKHLPLTEYEHVILCFFVAATMTRTLRHKQSIEKFYDELIERAEELEKAHNAPPTSSVKWRKEKENAHRLGVFQQLPNIAQTLFQMSLMFACANGKSARFITNDDPVSMFNPELQWQRFYGPGLGQKSVEVSMPVSPEIKLFFTWRDVSGFIKLDDRVVEDSNRMLRAQTQMFFVSSSPRLKRLWFWRVPLNVGFIFKALFMETKIAVKSAWFRWKHYGRFR